MSSGGPGSIPGLPNQIFLSNILDVFTFLFDFTGAALERVPRVPVNPLIFQISCKMPMKETKISEKPLKKEILIEC